MTYLTLAQAADRVQLSPRTLRRAIDSGDLEASELARGKWRVTEDALAAWLAARSNRQRPVRNPPAGRVYFPSSAPKRRRRHQGDDRLPNIRRPRPQENP